MDLKLTASFGGLRKIRLCRWILGLPRKKPAANHPPPPFSSEEEASEQNDAVQEHEPELPLKYCESVLDIEDDYKENRTLFPDTSNFIIKPIISESPEAKKHSSKRLAPSEPSGCGSSSRLKKEKFDLLLL
ncbi:hypothetical protein WN944_028094 [Citrus x changshan-huyou]|uniref:Uncharacterized protein n=1 Tax=Citrus x changshan-huyou TaxID=2935761 RepID=A0AAP0LJ59_9ROSI